MSTNQLNLFPTSKEELEDSLEKFLDKVKRYNRIANQYMFLEDRIEMSFLKKDLVKLLKDSSFTFLTNCSTLFTNSFLLSLI